MRVISRKALRLFWEEHPNAETGLLTWYIRISGIRFQSFNGFRKVFPSADLVGNFIVFNIGGNKYRLIAFPDYEYQLIFVRAVLTHAEYDKESWKNDAWFENT
jgi:mRNA interferase HigB